MYRPRRTARRNAEGPKRRKVFPIPKWVRALEEETGWNVSGIAKKTYKFLEDQVLEGVAPSRSIALLDWGNEAIFEEDFWSVQSRDVQNAKIVVDAAWHLLQTWMEADDFGKKYASEIV